MSVRMARACFYGLGLLLILCSIGQSLSATVAVTPEIDANSVATGLGLLTAGVLILRARRRK
jgi:hypothetical protein